MRGHEDLRGVDAPALARQMTVFAVLGRVLRKAVRRRAVVAPLPYAQVEVLRTVEAHPGLGTRAVAERLQLVPNTVSTIVGELVSSGLLSRVRDSGDRRVARLDLTAAGRQHLATWSEAQHAVLAAAMARLGEDDRRAISDALPAVRRLLEVLDEGDTP
ncbi:MarR family winged helix-turn-helix transcriptional regulator [Actinoplanes sp. URMC 104]|uniref:MarR family winged helix-turn-helix transcriptional regulator n=1 Tax=Actinoplanes sp. URMC 104 TaxID=3423409 RepID=UPI003F1BE8C9